jgi:hypothetical protein
MQSLFVSSEASSQTRITLNNTVYYMDLTYSTREDSWYLSISDVNKNILFQGVKLCFGVSATKHWKENTMGGNLYILRTKDSLDSLSRSNFGQGKLYELVYFSSQEESDLLGL